MTPKVILKRHGFWPLLLLLLPGLLAAQQVQLEFEGRFPELRDNAMAFIGTVEGRSADNLRRYARTAVKRTEEALRALGYYRPDIRWRVEEGDPALLVLIIDPGDPVRIRNLDVRVEGPAASDRDFLPIDTRRIAPGSVLNHGYYDSARQSIQNRALRLGYFDGRFLARRLTVDPNEGVADIELVYESGERYFLGEVTFEEGHGFELQLLERFVRFEAGVPYHADHVARLNSDLSNSGYFSQVIIDAPHTDAVDRVVPVRVELRQRDPRSVAMGIGFSTDVGPRLRTSWTEHWINERGHRRGLETELSEPRQSLSGWYELPLDPPMTDALRLTSGYQREQIEDVESERLTLGQQWRHQMDSGWMRVLSMRWEGERFRIGDQPSQKSSLLLPGIGFSKLQADSPMDPSRGFRLQLDVVGGHRAALSEADILQVVGVARGLYTLADRHRFLARAQVGGIATNRFSKVPPSLRFFAGGDQSVRGYGYETLSPREDGASVGGRFLLASSAEYQYSFSRSWRLAAFVDHGNAVNDPLDPLATGVGGGIRWVSPVGPLRLDIAKGLDDQFGGGWRLHFSMGPEL
ncbi:MAG: autotransporter assembly complex protein TamA [Marinobacter sp.]|nr:autotransporter assembly complex protein TamA [Marinobacter sp.]